MRCVRELQFEGKGKGLKPISITNYRGAGRLDLGKVKLSSLKFPHCEKNNLNMIGELNKMKRKRISFL